MKNIKTAVQNYQDGWELVNFKFERGAEVCYEQAFADPASDLTARAAEVFPWHFENGYTLADICLEPSAATVARKYGWKATKQADGKIVLSNRKGLNVVIVELKGRKYVMYDIDGVKLMSGIGMLSQSVEKLLTQYYHCQPITVNA